MANYRISGVWKSGTTITHYAIHELSNNQISRVKKISKSDAIVLLDKPENSAYTMVWNYQSAVWNWGEKITVITGPSGKFLRSNPDNQLTDNLSHLIDYNWIML